MKKMMFNDKYGLTKAVLEGRKTMTRRIAKAWTRPDGTLSGYYPSKFKVGEVVAVAQSYKDAGVDASVEQEGSFQPTVGDSAGWNNKMFVQSWLMPNRIRITSVRVERLQDISDEDCLREGIYSHTVELDEIPGVHPRTDYSYQAKIGSNIPRWWFPTPKQAFAALIDKVSGKGTWASNPWVFVYEFELVK